MASIVEIEVSYTSNCPGAYCPKLTSAVAGNLPHHEHQSGLADRGVARDEFGGEPGADKRGGSA